MSKEAMKSDTYGQALLSAWDAVRDPGPAGDDVPHPVFVQGFSACWNALLTEQEPVGAVEVETKGNLRSYKFTAIKRLPDGVSDLYTSPPAQRTWVGLTDEQMAIALPRPWPDEGDRVCLSPTELRQFAHGIKENT